MHTHTLLENNFSKGAHPLWVSLINQAADFFENHQKSKFGLPHLLTYSLTIVVSLGTKQSSAQSPLYTTIANSPTGYAFWGSNKCNPSTSCLFFFMQENY